jgi:aminoglycoside phosphotransferase (APT) family kinase protein
MNIQVSEILTSHFPKRHWVLRTATEGLAGKGYVAASDGLGLFIKLDVNVQAVQRVAELGIAPRVLASGSHNGRPYVIQEYLHGTHPDRAWFSLRLPQLAALIQQYHSDPVLAALLSVGHSPSYKHRISAEVDGMEAQLAKLPESSYKAELTPLLAELRDQTRSFEPVECVPTHADPNNNNFLLVGEEIYLLDWDGASLSDPIRDVGPLLWWYVPAEKWPEFFAAFQVEMSEQTAHKVYWWAARQSCMVALLFAAMGYPEQGLPFTVDFRAALYRQPNPHS